jgi:hypothetical protein
MTNELIFETEIALQKIASDIAAHIPQFVSLQADGSGSPKMLALRDALSSFPFPTDVLYIDNSARASLDEDPSALTLLRFDTTQPNALKVNFVDKVASEALPSCESVLRTRFSAFPGAVELICNLHLGSMWADSSLTLLVASDIRTHPEECARDLAREILMGGGRLRERFLQVEDFNLKYNLPLDPILSDGDLLEWDAVLQAHRDCSYEQISLRDRQERMASVQLIPQVPESVREVVRRAKRLYIFGHFEYSFFTVACHYAYSAVESAIFNRWNLGLPARLLLEHRPDVTTQESVTIDRTGWKGIRAYCENRKWSIHKLYVDGKRFPTSAAKLADRLHEEGILNDWQYWRMRNVYLALRNSHSHLEFCSTTLPGAGTIERAVQEINALFDSVPIPAI